MVFSGQSPAPPRCAKGIGWGQSRKGQRAAMAGDGSSAAEATGPAVGGVVFVNPESGPETIARNELTAAFPDGAVEECRPDAIGECVEQAVHDGPAYVAVAGGDGTIRA